MSIQVRLYGDLKKKVQQQDNKIGYPLTLHYEKNGLETIFDIIDRLNIPETELSHIFVNGKFCGIGKSIKDGDRIGLFPKRMALMFAEILKNNTISINIKLFADLVKFGTSKTSIDIPEGSTLNWLLEKYRFNQTKRKVFILINGIPSHGKNVVLQEGDTIAFFPPLGGGSSMKM